MKILHIITNLDTGGAQRIVSELVPEQRRNGVEAEVLIFKSTDTKFEKDLRAQGVRVNVLPRRVLGHPVRLLGAIQWYLRQFDVAHVHLFPTLYYVAAANTGIGTPLVFTEHSTHNRRRDHRMLRPLEKLVYGRYRAVTAISDGVREELGNWLGRRLTRRIHVVQNGIALPDDITPRPAGKDVLMVSRFTAAKDHKTVIDALEYVSDKEVRVIFAGEGDSLEEHRAYAEAKGLADRVVFKGNVPDIRPLIESCAVGVQSSHWEGFGLTIVEFMALGRPIIGTRVVGLRDVVGEEGLLFEQGDARELAHQIDRLLSDRDYYEHYRAYGLRRASDFDIKRTADEMCDLYAGIISQR